MSSSAEDRPPPRDPLLDDPAFAELVGPPPPDHRQDAGATQPVFAEPVDAPVESLPVAEVIRPKTTPVPPAAAPKIAPQIKMPVPVETEPPRPRWFAACSVIGCLGILSIAAIAALLWIAITLLTNLGDRFDAQPTSRTEAADKVPRGPLAPTALVNDIDIPLPGRVDAVARGGGGRFLLMRITNKREIHVFDVNQAKLVYSVPSKEPGTLFAAGADKIFVCDPLDAKLHRYGLFSGEWELTEKLPIDFLPRALVIAGESTGPLRVVASANRKLKIHQIDPVTLKPMKADDFSFPLKAESAVLARASNNGSVLGVSCDDGAVAIWYGTGNPTSKLLFDRNPKPSWAYPAPDGQFLYTPRGVFDSNGKPFAGTKSAYYTFPPAHGDDWFLSLEQSEEDKVSGTAQRHRAGETNLAKGSALDKAFLATTFPANVLEKDILTAADRIHYWPGAGLVAVLPYPRAEEVQKLQLFKLPVSEK